ncbi:spermidine acetyltransferase, partial [Listeria monocytogenes]|nr:spermidine acetyltransferase [Listeria monocytogenes]
FYTQGKYKDCYVMGLLKAKWIEQRDGNDDLSQVH